MPIQKGLPIEEVVRQYDELRNQEKIIKAQKERLSAQIKDHAERNGVKNDKGSYYCDIEGFIIGKCAKKKITFKDSACDMLLTRGFYDAVETIQKVKEEGLEKLIESGKITLSDLELITDTKTEYSVSVEPKEEIEAVIYQSEIKLPISAATKPKLFPPTTKNRR